MKRSSNISSKTLMLSIMILGVMVSAHWLATRALAAPKSDNKKQPAKMYTAGANADATFNHAADLMVQGKQIFQFDSFGDEKFWGDTLLLHQAMEGVKFGGVGPDISPKAALGLELKVDAQALPKKLAQQLQRGKVNLDGPAVTLDLVEYLKPL